MIELNWNKSSFQAESIIPESGDEVTTLWGIKTVRNLMNGYGIIGTIRLIGRDWNWLDFGLTRIYTLPPYVNILYRTSFGANLTSDDTQTLQNIGFNRNRFQKRVQVAIVGDVLGLRANLGRSFPAMDVYFRIHGV